MPRAINVCNEYEVEEAKKALRAGKERHGTWLAFSEHLGDRGLAPYMSLVLLGRRKPSDRLLLLLGIRREEMIQKRKPVKRFGSRRRGHVYGHGVGRQADRV